MLCFYGMNYLPLLLVVTSVVTFVVTYIWAIVNKDVSAYFPYISDTGTKPPESCVFSQLLNIAAALCLCTMYVRYKLVEALTGNIDTTVRRLNKIGLFLGILCALGLSFVANFQETNIEQVHLTGALLVFGVGTLYAFIQTGLSYQMYPEFNGVKVCRVRLFISCLALAGLIVTVISGTISRMQKDSTTDKLHWKPDEPYVQNIVMDCGFPKICKPSILLHGVISLPDPASYDKGFAAHVTSTIGEWVTAIVFMFYFLSFAQDFRKLRLEVQPMVNVRHLDEEPIYVDERTRLLG